MLAECMLAEFKLAEFKLAEVKPADSSCEPESLAGKSMNGWRTEPAVCLVLVISSRVEYHFVRT